MTELGLSTYRDIESVVHHWKWGYLGVEDKIEFVPTSWLRPLMLDHHGDVTIISNHELVDTEELGRRLCIEGLRYGAVVELNRKTRHARLIAGNHRLMAFERLGFGYFPAYVMVRDDFVRLPQEIGVDQSRNLTDRAGATRGDVVEAPSAVFLDIREMQAAGELPPIRTREDPPVPD